MSNYDKEVKDAWNRWENEPTIEAEPIKHGKWVKASTSKGYMFECSACNKIAYQVTGACGRSKDPTPSKCTYAYCPNCGAKMDEVEE